MVCKRGFLRGARDKGEEAVEARPALHLCWWEHFSVALQCGATRWETATGEPGGKSGTDAIHPTSAPTHSPRAVSHHFFGPCNRLAKAGVAPLRSAAAGPGSRTSRCEAQEVSTVGSLGVGQQHWATEKVRGDRMLQDITSIFAHEASKQQATIARGHFLAVEDAFEDLPTGCR